MNHAPSNDLVRAVDQTSPTGNTIDREKSPSVAACDDPCDGRLTSEPSTRCNNRSDHHTEQGGSRRHALTACRRGVDGGNGAGGVEVFVHRCPGGVERALAVT